ncbi:MAG: hypothetical protein IJ767_05920 [Bacteroidaceae bacterium]|nr:hypothetical protein [Bacteroidaceae bacterium]
MLENLTFCADNIRDLRDLIITSIWTDYDFRKYLRLTPAMNGEKLGFIGDLSDIGKAGAGCDPEYESPSLANSEKTWELGEWSVPLKLCYETLKGTIAEYTMKTGTDIADLGGSEIMEYILYPAIEKAIKLMFWRFAWFGDKQAANIADGGVLTAGVNPELFKTCDGLFKRLFAIGAADADRVTAIAANNAASYAAQKSGLLQAGVATGIVDAIRLNAPAQLSSNPNGVILMTRSLADALAYDVKQTYKQNMPWETIFQGLDIAEYDGVKVARLSIWDEMINKYENTGTKWNKPHRAVYSDLENLLVGIKTRRRQLDSQSVPDLFEGFDVTFDRVSRNNYVYASGEIGTQIRENDKVQLAY